MTSDAFRRFRRAPAFTGFVLFMAAIVLNVIVQGLYAGNPAAFFLPKALSTLIMSNAQFLLVCMAQSLLLISGVIYFTLTFTLSRLLGVFERKLKSNDR